MNGFIENAVIAAIQRQSFVRKNANTIVAGIGALTAVLSFLVTLPLPVDDKYTGIVPVVVAFLTALAVKITPNGIQPSMIDKLESTGMQDGPDLGAMVAEARRMAPAPQDVQSAIEAEVSRWQGQAQEALGQAQGVAQAVIDDYAGRHRGE